MGLASVLNDPAADFDALLAPMLQAARIPGAAIAIVAKGRTVFAKGYGLRNIETGLPMTVDTLYPIASTSKAINATLIGTFVEEGKLAWDTPVQEYLPGFRLIDSYVSAHVTLRDLVTMRTGLPRHEWTWLENPSSRADLVARLHHLEPSAGFRERFQYCNLTATAAGHVVEVVAGHRWEELAKERVFDPLGMRSTFVNLALYDRVTGSYHENAQREIIPSIRLSSEVTAPSGGSIHSTVEDMARWMLFNLSGAQTDIRQLVSQKTLEEIHTAQVVTGADATGPSPGSSYALGWFVDSYNGRTRLSHSGYLHDVNSDVMLFPQDEVGIVSFINFGFPRLARLINEHAFDLIMGFESERSCRDALSRYEEKIGETRKKHASLPRVEGTAPSHALVAYTGIYAHPAYGLFEVRCANDDLILHRNRLALPLRHWHYDAWIARDTSMFCLHAPHAFDPESRILFETDADGEVCALSTRLEPAVEPIRFKRRC